MIYQFDRNGRFIRSWEDTQEISKELDIRDISIKLVCEGKRRTTHDFVWKYDNDIIYQTYPLGSNELRNFIKHDCKRANAKKDKIVKDKRVKQFYLDGTLIKEWKNCKVAATELGLQQSSIGRVCKGSQLTCGGYIWRYNKFNLPVKLAPCKMGRKVYQYDLTGKYIKEWANASMVQFKLSISRNSIGACCKRNRITAGGYIWRYVLEFIEPELKVLKPITQTTLLGDVVKEWKSASQIEKELGYKRSNIGVACKKGNRAYGFRWRYKNGK